VHDHVVINLNCNFRFTVTVERLNFHAVLYRIFRKIVLPLEEVKQGTVLGIDMDLMEHAHNVTCHNNGLLSESQQDTSKIVRQQRTLQ